MKLIDLVLNSPHRLVVPLMGYPGVNLTRSTIRQNGFNSELHYRSVKALVERFHPDGVFFMMDLSIEAGALGLQIRYPLFESASVEYHPVRQVSDLDYFRVLDPLFDARVRSYIETMQRMSVNIKDCIRGGYVIGPFTLAGLMIGATDIAIATVENPELVHAVLNFTTGVISNYAVELVKAGAQMIAILEPTATFLSPRSFTAFSGNYIDRIVEKLDAVALLHICGDTSQLIPAMCATKAQGFSLDAPVNMGEAIKRMPADKVLIGNIDPVRVMVNEKPEGVREAVDALLEQMKSFPKFILSTGCDLPQDTPLENIAVFMEAGRKKY